MHFGGTATIRRMAAAGTRWRVRVETLPGNDGCTGRFLFEPDAPAARQDLRSGPLTLRGDSQEAVVAAAHDVPEEKLRQLLNSLA